MKNIIPIITTLAVTTALAAARDVELSDTPEQVRSTIVQNSNNGTIDEIDLIAIEGKVIYIAEIEFPQDREVKIYVAGDGALMKTREDVHLREAPEPVRSAILGLEGSVDDVDKETVGEKVSYHIELDRHGQPDLDVVISPEGRILSQAEEDDD